MTIFWILIGLLVLAILTLWGLMLYAGFPHFMDREPKRKSHGSGWKAIETAPKDGSEFLAYRCDADIFMVRWAAPVEFMSEKEIEKIYKETNGECENWIHEPDWMFADFIEGGRLDYYFTHWMPLPDKPLVVSGE